MGVFSQIPSVNNFLVRNVARIMKNKEFHKTGKLDDIAQYLNFNFSQNDEK